MRALGLVLAMAFLASLPAGCNKKISEKTSSSPISMEPRSEGKREKAAGRDDAKKEEPKKSLEKESTPEMAEAMVALARHPKQDQVRSAGILTAGSFDDNLEPRYFQAFLRKFSQSRSADDLPAKLRGQRVLILVKDQEGKPVGNARVQLSASGRSHQAELITRSDGRAVFVLSLDGFPAGQNLTVTVTPAGGAPQKETLSPGVDRWEVTLAGVRASLPRFLDLAIVLDTTGSMGDELEYLKSEMRAITSAIQERFPEVEQRYALVLYRDEGDEYVVRAFDFTTSIDQFHKRLSAQSAGGGGDYPEAMHRGLEEAGQLRWRQADAARVLFLVGDAPPHAQFMGRTMTAAQALRRRGIAIYPVACSGYDDAAELIMRASAFCTGGQFLFLTDDSGVGNSHGEPHIPFYQVQRLDRMMIRMIAGELSGRRIEPLPSEIIRTVGKKVG